MNAIVSKKWVSAVVLVLLVAAGFAVAHRLQVTFSPSSSMPATGTSPSLSSASPSFAARGNPTARPGHAPSTERPQRLVAALRLDPSLTQSIFLGERWVSPPDFFFAQPGTVFVVQAKAQHLDGRGEPHDVAGQWNATNANMVGVVRNARTATLEIRQPGDSDVTVAAAGQTVVLHIHAVQLADSIQVHIRQ